VSLAFLGQTGGTYLYIRYGSGIRKKIKSGVRAPDRGWANRPAGCMIWLPIEAAPSNSFGKIAQGDCESEASGYVQCFSLLKGCILVRRRGIFFALLVSPPSARKAERPPG
jgi:hypothetical protein